MTGKNFIKDTGIILLAGAVAGVLTSYGQTYLPDHLSQIANSYAVWLAVSFATALVLRSYWTAAIGGAVIQYIAIAVYYVASDLRFDYGMPSLGANAVWIIGGTLAGPVVGWLAYSLRQKGRFHAFAIPVIGGLFFSEALYQFINLQYPIEGVIFLCMGALIVVILSYVFREHSVKFFLRLFLCTILMYFAYGVVLVSMFS